MKFTVTAVLLASGAAAQLSSGGQIVLNALNAISSATENLDSAVKAYNGGSVDALSADLGPLLSAINSGNSAVAAGPTLVTSDATGLLAPLQSLSAEVKTTVDDTVAKKSTFDSAGYGYLILQSLQSILSATNTFISTTNSKLGPLSAAGPALETPITNALSSGIAAYAGETPPAGSGSASATASGSASKATTPPYATASGSVTTKASVSGLKSTSTLAPFTGAAMPTAAAAYGAVLMAGVGAVLAL